MSGEDANLNTLNDGTEPSGIAHGDVLVAFAEAIVGEDPAAIATARAHLTEAMGPAAMIEAAGVAANFQRMVRIADATGIPLGDGLEERSREVRADLNLDRFNHNQEGP